MSRIKIYWSIVSYTLIGILLPNLYGQDTNLDRNSTSDAQVTSNVVLNTQTQAVLASPVTQITNAGIAQETKNLQIETPEDRDKKRQAINEENLNEWRTPIEFYGIVEDESNNPVAGAHIDFDCNDTSPAGTSYYHSESDGNGLFSIKNIKGLLLGVYVNKDGYYSYDPHGQNFYYAGQNQNFVPDAGNPIVFRLRKKSQGANLIHYDRSFKLPRDGSPILIDLATGSIASSGKNTMQVEGWTHDDEKKQRWKYDWKCRVNVPNGGLQFYDEPFPFLAPESNYLPEDNIDMPVTNGVPWSDIVRRNYYIRTAAGNYGRMVFTMVAGGDNFCELNLYFNPSGSRNLEPAQK